MRRAFVVLLLLALPMAIYLLDEDNADDPVDTTAASATAPAPEPAPVDGDPEVTVRTVHDGDSFVAQLDGGGEVDVRMIGVNAPEFGECLYREARDALTQLLGGGPIQLERDLTDRDRYGRWLRYVHANGVIANLEIVERGLALVTAAEPDTLRRSDLQAAQQRARAAGLAIWNPQACGVSASTAVQIIEVEDDPPGRDSDNLNGEYVVIQNAGDAPVDMTGWKLRDDSTRNRFWFPDGFTIGPGRRVTVHVGNGQNSEDALYWGRRHPVWDNYGDTALLLDPNGNAVSIVEMGHWDA